MKTIKQVLISGFLFVFISQCSSAQKLEEKAPITFGEVYCQKWIAGVEGGGSGLNILIPTSGASTELDSVFFRGKAIKLETKAQNKSLYIGRFLSSTNQKSDIIMSNEPYAEYGNKMPKRSKKFPFELNENECVISYKQDNKTKYFKIGNIVEKGIIPYPSALPNKQ